MGLRESITRFFETHPISKKMLGVATAVAENFTILGSGSTILAVAARMILKTREDK